MSRTLIATAAAAVIALVTAAAIVITGSSLTARARKDAVAQVSRSQQLLARTALLESLRLKQKAEQLSADAGFLKALKAPAAERNSAAGLAFQRFITEEGDANKPDILAIVDSTGDLAAMEGVGSVIDKDWKNDKGELIWPGVAFALSTRTSLSEVWDYQGKGLMRVGIASIIDPDATPPAGNTSGVVIAGAVIVAYSSTAADAVRQGQELGTSVAFFSGDKVYATSFRQGNDEDTGMQKTLAALIKSESLDDSKVKAPKLVTINGESFLAGSTRLPRQSSKPLPDKYPAATAAALVLMPASDVEGLHTIRFFLILLGFAAIVLIAIVSYLSSRRILDQVDRIESGVADIINGNIDRTFRPVGRELDGLANALNVMLARLLGRPEPGEEELDDDGNPIVSGRVEFDDSADATKGAPDPELARLAEESEPDYYKRIFTEYVQARKSIGSPDEVSFENFIAKLKMNEGKLKAQHQCRAVRFRVLTKDGKVSLKPVPIFS